MKLPVGKFAMLKSVMVLMAFSVAGLISQTLFAAVPASVGYQGRLYDANNNPINGNVSVVFAVYSNATGGTAIWTETQSVSFSNGYFAVQLGSVNAFGTSTFDGTVRYLGVTVGTDAEMTPRASIASVPYALNAPPDTRFGTNTSLAVQGNGSTPTTPLCYLGQVILTAGTLGGSIYLPAQGQLLQINQNTALFSLLGTTYGGDGRSTFALPDLRGAAPNGLTYSICISGIFP